MPKRKSGRKKTSTPKTTHTHIMGASGVGKQELLSATMKELRDAGKPVGILDSHGELLPKPSTAKSKKG
jgi:DNA replication protein DnaC